MTYHQLTHDSYEVRTDVSGRAVGHLDRGVDGYFYFWPNESSAWSTRMTREIAAKIDELNGPWDELITRNLDVGPEPDLTIRRLFEVVPAGETRMPGDYYVSSLTGHLWRVTPDMIGQKVTPFSMPVLRPLIVVGQPKPYDWDKPVLFNP